MSGKTTAAALLAAVFFAGVATTLGILRVVEHRQKSFAAEARPPFRGERPGVFGRPGGLGETRRFMELARMQVTEHMQESLDLTDEQKVAIDNAMERSRVSAQETMTEFLPRLQGQMDSLQAEIGRILTPAQREAYAEFRRQDRDRFNRAGPRRTRPPAER